MGRRYDVDVVAADPLQVQHHAREFLVAHFTPPPLVGDGPVLAENAPEVAVGNEDGPGPVLAGDGLFFAEVGMGAVDHRPGGRPAEPFLPLQPVHPAPPRAQLAPLEDGVSLLHPIAEFPLSFQSCVPGLPLGPIDDLGARGNRGPKRTCPGQEGNTDKIPTGEFHGGNSVSAKVKTWFRIPPLADEPTLE